MQHAVMDWLNSQAAVWYEEGISKLVSRYDKCLIVQGDYVEKWVKVCDKTCIFCLFPVINKYLCMTKRSLLSGRPSCIGWLRHCATNRKVAGSISDGVIGFFH